MAFSGDLKLEIIATGEKAGLWGTITNDNLKILELASTGYFTTNQLASGNLVLNLADGSSLGATTATGKNLMIEVTGTLTANRVITMPISAERIFIIKDSTVRSNSNYTIGVQNVGGSGTGIKYMPVGSTCVFYTDGTSANSMKLAGILNKGTVQVQTGTNTPYTAISGDVVLGETSNGGGGAITVNLPASPNAGDTVTIMDASLSGGFASNNCTVGRNSSPIQGAASDLVLNTNNQAVTLVYTNATKGWQKQSTNS